jgi:hypothetical protein
MASAYIYLCAIREAPPPLTWPWQLLGIAIKTRYYAPFGHFCDTWYVHARLDFLMPPPLAAVSKLKNTHDSTQHIYRDKQSSKMRFFK